LASQCCIFHVTGPDQILPSTAIYTWNPQGAVRLSIEQRELADRAPISVPSLLKKCADRSPDKLAMTVKRDGEWQKWTYKYVSLEYYIQ
jgi:hypothetical protein